MSKKELAKMKRRAQAARKKSKRIIMAKRPDISKSFMTLQSVKNQSFVLFLLDKRVDFGDVKFPFWMLLEN